MDSSFLVIRADKYTKNNVDVRASIAKIFADGFSQWLHYFSKDKNVIEKAFAHMFVLNQFYICIIDHEVASMVACTNCKELSVKLDKKELRKYLGFFKGTIAYFALKKDFEKAFTNPPVNTGSIEFVGTDSKFRGRGAASKVFQYIFENAPYKTYLIEEVADTNTSANNLYKKLGFTVYRTKKLNKRQAKATGINEFIAYKLEVDKNK